MPVIGFLHSASPGLLRPQLEAFRQALGEAGYVEGRNVAIEYRWAEGQYDQLPAMAADLVRRQMAVIIAGGGEPTAVAAKAATATIPIVFIIGNDPVRVGLVASLSRPGGNATGVNVFTTELDGKRLGLLHELVPTYAVIAHLVNPTYPPAETNMREVEAAARMIGRQIVVVKASTESEIDAAFATIRRCEPERSTLAPTLSSLAGSIRS
jgi:putative tryptophan/tyrosine transport system substrate-binding protein